MYLYVEDLTEKDFCYNSEKTENEYLKMKQEMFKANALEALENKPKKEKIILCSGQQKVSKNKVCAVESTNS